MTFHPQPQTAEAPALSIERQRELVARAKCGDQAARDALWRANSKLVGGIVQKKSTLQDCEDLKSEAFLIFCKAIERFDLDRGTAFSNFLSVTLAEDLKHVKSRLFSVVRVPERLYYGGRAAKVTSFEEELNEDGLTLYDTIAAEADSPWDGLERTELRECIQKHLARLKERERAILTRRFGLDGGEALSEVRVGKEFGITGSAVGQMTRTTLEKMRVRMTESALCS